MQVTRDVPYRPEAGVRGLLDVYLPDTPAPHPIVVCIHGGGWYQGDKSWMREHCEILAGIGVVGIAMNYRFTGTDTHPAQVDDVFAVFDWVVRHAGEHRFDPMRIGIMGSSAGGHLAALVGLMATSPGRAAAGSAPDHSYVVRCMMPLCGVHDFNSRMTEHPNRTFVIEKFLGGPIAETAEALNGASPVNYAHANAPVCLAVHGAEDDRVQPSQSEYLVNALRSAGADAELLIVPGAGHGRYQPDTDPPEPLGGAERLRAFFTQHLLAG